jgi:hypothetical protein
MSVFITHGPDRERLVIGPDGQLVASKGVPFHGIASRATLSWLASSGTEWDAPHASGAQLAALRELEVLSLTESAVIATAALGRVTGGSSGMPPESSELWNVKEGHTASVWVATLPTGEHLVLNVGRDPEASAELAVVTERLRVTSLGGDQLAEVRDGFWIERSPAGEDGFGPVYVAVHAYVDQSMEIHRIADRYALVERFLTDPSEPTRITSVVGRWATPKEATAIDDLCTAFEDAAGPLGLELTVNDGDLVWADGRGPVVVAAGLAPDVREGVRDAAA